MKILQVIPYLNPKRGGDVNVCCMISKELAHRGHGVTIITTDFEFDIEFAKSLEDERLSILMFHCNVNISLLLISYDMIIWIKNNIFKYNVVHLHDFRTFQNIVICYYATLFNVPYILQSHGDMPYNNNKNLRKMAFDYLLGYRIIKKATKLIALNINEASAYEEMGADLKRIINIPNGINLSDYLPLPEKGKFRKEYGINSSSKIELFLSRIDKSKGLDMLMSAFKEVIGNYEDTILIFVGPDYGEQSNLAKLANRMDLINHVIFTGFVKNDTKISALIDADVFVTPKFVGFPITFIEACFCGKPIITTNKIESLDWINNNVGIVVDYDKYALRDAILRIMQSPNLCNQFGEKGRQLVSEEFNWEKIVKRLEYIYK